MNISKLSLIIAFLSAYNLGMMAQSWDLEMETDDGIQIYTRFVEDQPLKQVKIEFEHETNLCPLVSLITNPEKYTDFVYKSISYKELEEKKENDKIFYGQIDFPWPLADRDFYVSTNISQDSISKTVTIETKSIDQMDYPEMKNFVRISSHHNIWKLTPTEYGTVKGEYWLNSDPSGTIPQWAINMMIHEGSVKTIQQLLSELQHYEYQDQVAFIKER